MIWPQTAKITAPSPLSSREADHGPTQRADVPPVSADGIAFGPDGAVYIADGNAGAVEDVIASAAPLDVAFGPDGLYVADFASGAILLQPVGASGRPGAAATPR